MMIKRFAACFLVLVSMAGEGAGAAEMAGRVLLAVGHVSTLRAGKEIPLAAGASVESGDVLQTGAASNAQIRFTDGGVVALRPDTTFQVNEYHFTGKEDGSQKGFFSLLRGGFRTISGLIGKTQRETYKVSAPAATIGIRGTNYTLMLCEKNCAAADGSPAQSGLYGGVTDGRIAVGNESGEKEFGRDEFFFVADMKSSPQPLLAPPDFLRDRLEGQVHNEQRRGKEDNRTEVAELTNDGRLEEPAVLGNLTLQTLTSSLTYQATEDLNQASTLPASGLALMTAAAPVGGNYALGETAVSSGAYTLSGARLTSYSLENGLFTGQAGATFTDVGSDAAAGNVNWGHWGSDASATFEGYTPSPATGYDLLSGVHYIYGDPTPYSVIAGMTGTVYYNFAAGTHATDSAGSMGGSLVSGSMIVNFTAQQLTPNFNYSVGGSSYYIQGFSLPIHSDGMATAGTGITGTSYCSGGSCSTSASINVVMNAGFTGSAAQGLIVSTATNGPAGTTAVTALFKK
jgi:hypothetical protein